jgi:ABC-2 type transport system permease protein
MPRLWLQVLSLEMRKLMSYRMDFWMRFAGSVGANVIVAYYLWSAVFAHTGRGQIGGYTFSALILYYLLVPLIENVARSAEWGGIAEEIYSGGLTKFIVYPTMFFPFKYMAVLAASLVAIVQLVAVLALYLVFVGLPEGVALDAGTVALGLVFATCAGLLSFLMSSMFEQVAFWADRVWSLNVMLNFTTRLLGGAMLPLAMFPDWCQKLVLLLPFPYLVSLPVQAMMGRVDAWQACRAALVMAVWCLIFAAANRLLWARGALRYTGVGI